MRAEARLKVAVGTSTSDTCCANDAVARCRSLPRLTIAMVYLVYIFTGGPVVFLTINCTSSSVHSGIVLPLILASRYSGGGFTHVLGGHVGGVKGWG